MNYSIFNFIISIFLYHAPKHRKNIAVDKIETHLATLVSLNWNHFKGHSVLNEGVALLRDDLDSIESILAHRRDQLVQDSKRKASAKDTPFDRAVDQAKSVPAAFRKALNRSTVVVGDDQFFTEVKPNLKSKDKKSARRPAPFTVCVRESVNHVFKQLRRKNDYDPIALTDEEMGLETYAEVVCNQPFLSPDNRRRYRAQFRDELAKGVQGIHFCIWGKVHDRKLMNLFVFKVPSTQGPDYVGNITKAIKVCEAMAPKHMSAEAVAHFNHIMSSCANVPSQCREALGNYLFFGDPDPNNKLESEYVDFVIDLANGLPIDESLFVDKRANNSRGGKGSGFTKYDDFFEACREVLLPDSAVDERRHGDTMHASGAYSIVDLHRQVSINCT